MSTISKKITALNSKQKAALHPDEGGFYCGEVDGKYVKPARVTSVIGQAIPTLDKADPDKVEDKRLIGQTVHEAISLDINGTLDETTLDDIILPYFNAWRKFRETWLEKIIASEIMIYHNVWQYAGTFDLLCRMRGKIALVDFKCRKVKKLTDALQLAAYNEGLRQFYGIKADLLFGLELGSNTEFRLTDLSDPGALSTFLGALKLYKWRLKNGTS